MHAQSLYIPNITIYIDDGFYPFDRPRLSYIMFLKHYVHIICNLTFASLSLFHVANYLGVRQITHVITCKTCFVNYLRNYAVKLRRNFPSYALANYLRNYVQNAQNPRNLRKLRGNFFIRYIWCMRSQWYAPIYQWDYETSSPKNFQ